MRMPSAEITLEHLPPGLIESCLVQSSEWRRVRCDASPEIEEMMPNHELRARLREEGCHLFDW